MMNDPASAPVSQPLPSGSTAPQLPSQPEWKGLTLDELRLKRAVALVRREMGKERMNMALDGMRTRVADNGLRGLMFNDKTITGLKTADYVFLGWNLSKGLMKLWRKMR